MKLACSHCGCMNDVGLDADGQGTACKKCGSHFQINNAKLQPCTDCYCLISKRAAVCPFCGTVFSGTAAPASMPAERAVTDDNDNIFREEEIMDCHPAAISYIFQILLGILLIPVLVGIVILIRIWIDIYFTSYRITNKRIIVDTGILDKKRNEIWIKDMRGAAMQQTLWQRIIRVGNINIGTAATADTEIRMSGIKNPRYVVDTINSLRVGN